MKVLIVDDEPLARQRMARFLETMEFVELVGEAENGIDAIDLVNRYQPDLLLLDIRMPGMNGLEVAAHIAGMEEPPAIIFVTAFEEYALEAFKVQAVDYLLKPVRLKDLEDALKKATKVNRLQATKLMDSDDHGGQRTHLSIRSHRGLDMIPMVDVRCFRAEQKYVVVYSSQGEKLLDEPLKDLEQEFCESFIRIHRNSLVALRFVERLSKNDQGQAFVHLEGMEMPLQVSRRHLSAVRKKLQNL